MPKKLSNEETTFIDMAVSLRESNLIRKIRRVEGNGEFLLVIETGEIKRIKYSKLFFQLPHDMSNGEMSKLIQDKVPFGEITILTRNGKPYAISTILQYDDLSSGL
mgnify:CR=1 FL=1